MKKIVISILATLTALGAYATDFPAVYTYDTAKQTPFELNVPVPDGNYVVTMKIGSRKKAGKTFVKVESRRLAVNNLCTAKGETQTVSFVVNKRDTKIRENGSEVAEVQLKQREIGKLNWDDCINIEVGGEAPVVESITVEPATDVTTVFLCGDSTVVDQDSEPWASWGQMFPWFFDTKVAVANYAESGERADSFIAAGRLRKILSLLQPGDYVIVEFGHNDQKIDRQPGKGAYYFFATQLKTFIDEVRLKGGVPVLVTPTHRRNFDKDGKVVETHLNYPEAMKWVAEREGTDFIDLHAMSAKFYEALGPDMSKKAFVHYKAGEVPGMDRDVADNTHFNPYGAFELAKCVVAEIMAQGMPLSEHVINFSAYSPAQPDPVESFYWYNTPPKSRAEQVLEKDDKAFSAARR